MGIGGFHGWMNHRFPGAYVGMDGTEVHHLYVDMSSVLHAVSRKSRHMDDFVFKLNTKLLYLLEITNPTISVVFAMDGPAPLAKLLTQRSRRQKDARRRVNSDAKKPQEVSKQALTPGTPFMLEVQNVLEFFICQRLCSRRWSGVEFELLGCTVEGEGELKIIDRILADRQCVEDADNHVILGGDSDLMLMAMLSSKPNLYVVNDNQAMFSSHIGLHGERMARHAAEQRKFVRAFSVNDLRDVWLQDDSMSHLVQTDVDMMQLTLDLATIIISANGNDYLPAVRGVLSSKTDNPMWEKYLELRAKDSPEYKNGLVVEVPLTASPDVVPWGTWRSQLSINESFLTSLLKDSSVWIPAPEHNPSHGFVENKPRSYLQGLAWNLNMYIEGQCCDYRYVYHGSAPTAAEFMTSLENSTLSSKRNDTFRGTSEEGKVLLGPLESIKQRLAARSVSDDARDWEGRHTADEISMLGRRNDPGRPLLPNAFAMALMPGSAIAHVPGPLQHLMTEGSPVADIYRECPVCIKLSKEASQLQTAYTRVRAKISALRDEIESWDESQQDLGLSDDMEHGEDPMSQAREMLLAMEDQAEQWKIALRDLQNRQLEHQEEVHPYKPFPVERLEQAVRSIPQSQYLTSQEKEVTRFGRSYCFRRGLPRNPQEKLFRLPLPPVSTWKRVQVPSKNPITRKVVQKGGQPPLKSCDGTVGRAKHAGQASSGRIEASLSYHYSWSKRGHLGAPASSYPCSKFSKRRPMMCLAPLYGGTSRTCTTRPPLPRMLWRDSNALRIRLPPSGSGHVTMNVSRLGH